MGEILVGTSSWADASLVQSGRFYPPEIKTPAERLEYYSGIFRVTEIDSSYHYFPTRRNLDLWLNGTPGGFTFDVRAFSMFTGHPTQFRSLPASVRVENPGLASRRSLYLHHLPEETVDRLWQIFNSYVEAVKAAGKLGVVLFQFPPWFHPTQENREYLLSCCRRLSGCRMAIEFRTGDWLTGDELDVTLSFLREHRLSLVCVDEPQGLKTSVPPVDAVTAPVAVVRFHGRNTENWEKKGGKVNERFNYLYSHEELEDWAGKILRMSGEADRVHVVFKNKYEDYSVRNARQFMELLKPG